MDGIVLLCQRGSKTGIASKASHLNVTNTAASLDYPVLREGMSISLNQVHQAHFPAHT